MLLVIKKLVRKKLLYQNDLDDEKFISVSCFSLLVYYPIVSYYTYRQGKDLFLPGPG